MISLVGSLKRIFAFIYRANRKISSWHLYYQQSNAILFHSIYIIINKNIGIYLLTVNSVPKILPQFFMIINTLNDKAFLWYHFSFILKDSKHYHSTLGICERTVCLIHRVRNFALCFLTLYIYFFSLVNQAL